MRPRRGRSLLRDASSPHSEFEGRHARAAGLDFGRNVGWLLSVGRLPAPSGGGEAIH